MTLISDLAEVGVRARRRVACRLLPFVFLIYVVNYIDRVNVSFADLRPRGNFVVNSSSSDWPCRNARQNGWHSDKTGERRLHAAIPLLIAASMYGSLIAARHNIGLAVLFLLLGRGFLVALHPIFVSIPTLILSESAAAATFGLINSIGQLGGFTGPYMIGYLNDRTHSLTASFGFIAFYVAAASLILTLRIHDPLQASQASKSD